MCIRDRYKGNFLQLGEGDILVIEGIHCLNDRLSYTLPADSKFKIYISALTPVSYTHLCAHMDNQKRENLLNLALDATEEERLKSVNLNVGYDPREKTWELIVLSLIHI